MESTVFDESESKIQKFYANRSVFITGVTGFVGKILLEKLLRCCSDVKALYVLIRPRKGKSPSERLEMILEKECFEPLKEKFPSFRDKMVIVVGDIVQPRCGLSDEDFETLQSEVSIVLHSAARVQFLDPLRMAVQGNVIGTRNVLELSKQLPLLEAFVHVSTAFVRIEPDFTVPEEVGGCHMNHKTMLSMLECLDDEAIKKITRDILKDKNTTYQFSKALAEVMLEEEKGNVPLSIIRPCLVSATWKEPLMGWCDIFQGMSGLFVAAGKGFLRTLYAPPRYRVLLVPADVVVNCVIASAWYIATERPRDTFVVNCTEKYEDFPVGQELLEPLMKLRTECPLSSIYRYPDFTVYKYKWLFKIHSAVDHYIPAIVIDALLFIFTGRTMMIRLYKKVDSLWAIFVEQGSHPWYFNRDNYNKIKNSLSSKDSEIFFIDTETLNYREYIPAIVHSGRKFLCKEDPSTIPYAVTKGRIWWLVTTVLKWCFILFLIYYLIPQSFLDSASTHFQHYLHNSEPMFGIRSDEINRSDAHAGD